MRKMRGEDSEAAVLIFGGDAVEVVDVIVFTLKHKTWRFCEFLRLLRFFDHLTYSWDK